ncbi:hypothetical protein [Microbacterium deminutum]
MGTSHGTPGRVMASASSAPDADLPAMLATHLDMRNLITRTEDAAR